MKIPALSREEDRRATYIVHCMLLHEDKCLKLGIHANSKPCPVNKTVDTTCKDCGKKLLQVNIKTKRCPECNTKNTKEYNKKWRTEVK